jgi:CDP-diacylglycerol--glycerol-3-phosphate 3-phosphatidyltransferase
VVVQRQVQREDSVAEDALADCQCLVEVGAWVIEAGDDHSARHVDGGALLPEGDGAGVDAVDRVDHEQRRVGCSQPGPELADEVGVPRRIQQVDLDSVLDERREREAHRSLLLDRRGVVVADRVALGHDTSATDGAGRCEQRLDQCRLARARMAHQHDVSHFAGVGGHRPRPSDLFLHLLRHLCRLPSSAASAAPSRWGRRPSVMHRPRNVEHPCADPTPLPGGPTSPPHVQDTISARYWPISVPIGDRSVYQRGPDGLRRAEHGPPDIVNSPPVSAAAAPRGHRTPERTPMLNLLARARLSRVLDPIGAALARAGLSPDVVTVAGTIGVVVSSLVFVARGHLVLGMIFVTLAVLTDMLDGAIARARGTSSRWGAFLDSTMDRIADCTIFATLAYWLATSGQPRAAAAALVCLVVGVVVSYAKARAEGLGMRCDVGIAERTERLVVAGLGALLQEVFGVPHALEVGLWLLALLAVVTVGQRLHVVWRQTREPA